MHHNGKGRKLGSRGMRRYRGGRERQKVGQIKITRSRARQLKISISFYSPARGSRPAYCVREDSWSRTRRVESGHSVLRRSAVDGDQRKLITEQK